MRTKDQIMIHMSKIMERLPKEGRIMVDHEHLFLEVWIDIRDILNSKSDNLKAAEIDNDTVKLIHSDKE